MSVLRRMIMVMTALAVLLTVTAAFAELSIESSSIDIQVIPVTDGEVLSGTCGSGLTWAYARGLLIVSGSGEMCACASGAQWGDVAADITSVSLGAGVKSVTAGAFSDCTGLTSVHIAASVDVIEAGALPSGGYTVYCHEGSCACTYAAEHGLSAVVSGHIEGTAARERETAPTKEASGSYYMTVRCLICGKVLSETAFTIPARVPGDVNDDGVTDGRDLLRLMKYLRDDTVEINAYNADVTGDGDINAMDTLRLEKYLAGMDVSLE